MVMHTKIMVAWDEKKKKIIELKCGFSHLAAGALKITLNVG